MRAVVVLLAALLVTPLAAQQNSIDQLKASQQLNMSQMKLDFNNKVDKMRKEYDEKVELMKEEHKKFQQEITQKWGDEEPVETTPKTWVEYSDDESTRSVVDFESGNVKVEVLLSEDDFDSEGNVLPGRMERAVEMALSSRGHTLDYKSQYEERKEVSSTAILENMVDLSTIGAATSAITAATAPSPSFNQQNYTASSSSSSYTSGQASASSSSAVLGAAPPVSTKKGRAKTKAKAKAAPAASVVEPPKPEPKPVVVAKPEVVEPPKPEPKPVVVATPKPVVVATPKPVVVATPKPVVVATPKPVVVAKPKPVVVSKPKPVVEPKKEVESVAKKIVETVKPVVTTKTSSDGSTKKVATIELKLVEDHLSERAASYRSLVKKYSEEFGIDEPVIYAIMEQESAFNPVAKSWVPAYGLMQLVPTSGGRDAYNYVYKKDKIVSGDYLFKPENNIELGAAYFKILKTRNFHKVTDPECQLLCMVASYNCGAGNVSRAITGNTNLSKAIPQINEMDYDKLYKHLSKHLPDETKDYIYKITRNIKKYSGQ